MTEAAAKSGRVTQLGNHSAPASASGWPIELLRRNVIGPVEHVVIMAHRPGIEPYRAFGPRPANGSPPPANLNWDLWLGTAPYRPFASGLPP